MKVLVLDDDENVLKVVKTVLRVHGHESDCAGDAAVAVEMLKTSRYDLVLFDFNMPEHDGIWFLQNADIPRSTRAVLMTGNGTQGLIDRVMEMGASDYLIKPFTVDDLLRQVEVQPAKAEDFSVLPGVGEGLPVPC